MRTILLALLCYSALAQADKKEEKKAEAAKQVALSKVAYAEQAGDADFRAAQLALALAQRDRAQAQAAIALSPAMAALGAAESRQKSAEAELTKLCQSAGKDSDSATLKCVDHVEKAKPIAPVDPSKIGR